MSSLFKLHFPSNQNVPFEVPKVRKKKEKAEIMCSAGEGILLLSCCSGQPGHHTHSEKSPGQRGREISYRPGEDAGHGSPSLSSSDHWKGERAALL